ncbi:MAG: phosphotransferase, partial [Planctomycetota bacterium]
MNPSSRNPAADETLSLVLDAFGLAPPGDVQAAGGTATAKWVVTSAAGRFVLRVRPAEVADEESIRFDHEVLRRLAAAGLPFPTPLARNDGSTWLRLGDRVYEVFPWVAGEPFDYGDAEAVHRLGTFLARFHQALGQDVPPGKEGRLREDHPSLLEPYVSGLCRLASSRRERGQLERISEQLE